MVKKKRVRKTSLNWLRLKRKTPENYTALDLAAVREDATEVFAKSAGMGAYFRFILPPKQPWWRRLISYVQRYIG